MDQNALRAAQAPLKEQYRADPASAAIPSRATASFAEPGVTVTVDGFTGAVRAGLHPAAGGTGLDACSADLLLQALLGCAGTTFRAVATASGVDIRRAELTATGTWDARGTLGLDREVPVGIQGIRVTIAVDTDADDERLAKMAVATERYCVVAQTLATPPDFVVTRL
ncbi:MAG: OsmC family protein [Microbacteriaceae bacterium]|nr:OsmC family protein [Microbacteriaceae bacterium]